MKHIGLIFGLLTATFVVNAAPQKAAPQKAAASLAVQLDAKTSQVKWVGSKITNSSHHGTVDIKEGSVTFKENIPTAGTFTLDMTTIKNEDLTDVKMNQKLIGHLSSDDFFAVQKYPTAVFKLTKSEKSKAGDLSITGDLTIKGITKPVTFPAVVKLENGVYSATGKFKINRTNWDIKYNSGSFFDPKKLGDKLIHDDIEIEINLRTVKS